MPNNLNQLARWANTHAAAVEAVEVVHRPRVVRANPNVAPSGVNFAAPACDSVNAPLSQPESHRAGRSPHRNAQCLPDI